MEVAVRNRLPDEDTKRPVIVAPHIFSPFQLSLDEQALDEGPYHVTGRASAYRNPLQPTCVVAAVDYTRTSSASCTTILADCPGIAALISFGGSDAFALGTGADLRRWGVAIVDPQPWVLGTSAYFAPEGNFSKRKATPRPKSVLSGASRANRLASIQSSLALPLRIFAQVLGRSPTQLYKWLDPTEVVDLQKSSEQRIGVIEQIARSWDRRAKSPLGTSRKHVLSNGRTIVDILVADSIDERAAEAALSEIAEQLEERPMSLSRRMQQRGFSRRRRKLPDDDV
jgi:hypothetical protein